MGPTILKKPSCFTAHSTIHTSYINTTHMQTFPTFPAFRLLTIRPSYQDKTMTDPTTRNLPRGPRNPLYKQISWSPDIHREEAWTTRRNNNRLRRGRSVTEDDIEELKACFDLGFRFDSPDLDPKLSNTLPALELYLAVNRQLDCVLSRSSSATFSDVDSSNESSIIDPGEDPETVKTKLKQWTQVVACSVRQFSQNKIR